MADYEVELKFRAEDMDAMRSALQTLGATPEQSIRHRDCYFAHPSRNFGQTDEALRLRSSGDENCITYKGPRLDAETKSRTEIEVPFQSGPADAARMDELLRGLGFREVRRVVKRRTPFRLTWQSRAFTLDLDEVEGLGSFLEIETMAGAHDWEQARDSAKALAARLGLDSPERRSYLELLLEQD